MSESLTQISVKKINNNKVYACIYREKAISKNMLVNKLNMSLSTVEKNLKALTDAGMIYADGYFESTGGRKAKIYAICQNYRYSIGIAILSNCILISALNLYGDSIANLDVNINFEDTKAYYDNLQTKVIEFISINNLDQDKILGIGIALPMVLNLKTNQVIFSKILVGDSNNIVNNLKVCFKNYQLSFYHDSIAAAFYEHWKNKVNTAAVLLLNDHLGGALIINGQVQLGDNYSAGLLEHMQLHHRPTSSCYCGSKGCSECYCAANVIKEKSKTDIDNFFLQMDRNTHYQKIWQTYLQDLALIIKNINRLIDGKIILSGTIAYYIKDNDLNTLLKYINDTNVFYIDRNRIISGSAGAYTQSYGAAICQIKTFLDSFDNELI